MYVRLAFAVAAHLEPEILLVDEVLAVGDADFQRKCLGKMGDVTREGRTVLFVSHNMSVIQALCERGIFILDGCVHTDAPIDQAVSAYLKTLEATLSEDLGGRTDRKGEKEITVEHIEISGTDGLPTLATGAPARFTFRTTGSHRSMSCRFTILNQLGHPLAEFNSEVAGPNDVADGALAEGMICDVDELPLLPGRYRVDVEVRARGIRQDVLEMAAVFDVEEGTLRGRPIPTDQRAGDIVLPHRWTLPAG